MHKLVNLLVGYGRWMHLRKLALEKLVKLPVFMLSRLQYRLFLLAHAKYSNLLTTALCRGQNLYSLTLVHTFAF
jgi:hypothetical protein